MSGTVLERTTVVTIATQTGLGRERERNSDYVIAGERKV